MKKKLSSREVVLLVFLGIIVLGLSYYKFLYQPLSAKISEKQIAQSEEQSVVDQYTITATKLDQMQSGLDEIKGAGDANPIPAYNNSTELMKELYSILSEAESYTLSFGSVVATEGSYIVDRPVSISFETKGYEAARSILESIEDGKYVSQISDMTISFPTYSEGDTFWNVFTYPYSSWDGWGTVNVGVKVTFYEIKE